MQYPIIIFVTEREINRSVFVLCDRIKRVPPSSKNDEIPSTARPSREEKGARDHLVRGNWRKLLQGKTSGLFSSLLFSFFLFLLFLCFLWLVRVLS